MLCPELKDCLEIPSVTLLAMVILILSGISLHVSLPMNVHSECVLP